MCVCPSKRNAQIFYSVKTTHLYPPGNVHRWVVHEEGIKRRWYMYQRDDDCSSAVGILMMSVKLTGVDALGALFP